MKMLVELPSIGDNNQINGDVIFDLILTATISHQLTATVQNGKQDRAMQITERVGVTSKQ